MIIMLGILIALCIMCRKRSKVHARKADGKDYRINQKSNGRRSNTINVPYDKRWQTILQINAAILQIDDSF